ncbi:MAG: SctK family type III secretion system sorting platform protein [Pseudomonadota bacterium]
MKEQRLLFNFAPVTYVHDSWFESLPQGQVCRHLATKSSGRSSVSQHLLENRGISKKFFYDFKEPRSRLALLETKYLEDLFLYVGALLRNAEFRNELDGKRILTLRKFLGPSVLEYATKRAPFAGPVPDFHYEPDIDGNPRLRLIQIGAVYSISPRASSDPAYLQRLALKLPQRISTSLLTDLPHSAGEPEDTSLPKITRRIVREMLPKWLPLFA